MFDAYDRILIINLESRADRRREMTGELRRAGLEGDHRVSFFKAMRATDPGKWRSIGEHGCFLSHLGAVKQAAGAGESLLLLEDDADFTRAASLPQPDVDILWGGYTLHGDDHVEGAHCMGFSARAVKLLAPFLEKLLALDSPPPADGAYTLFRRAHPEMTVHFADPQLASQRPSDSDITADRGWKSRLPKPILAVFRSVKRQIKRRAI